MEEKNNTKQWVVAAIILVVVVLLFMLAFSGKKEPAPTVTAPETKAEATAPAAEQDKPSAVEKAAEQRKQPEEKQKPAKESQAVSEEASGAVAAKAGSETPKPQKKAIKVEPQNVVLTFTATSEKDFNYEVFYTVEREVWFDAGHMVEYPGKAGTHRYSIVIPSDEVYRIRLDFASNPGTVTVKDIYLMGAQRADLNQFGEYELNQIDKAVVNEDGSFTIISAQDDPYMAYRSPLLPE
jgi:hypothetical protein